MKHYVLTITILLSACIGAEKNTPSDDIQDIVINQSEWVDLSERDKPVAITQSPWQEVVINVSDFNAIAPLLTDIGYFKTLEKSDTEWLLAAPSSDGGFVRLVNIGEAPPARPSTSRAWDKGCYFSLMMRAKNLQTIIDDAEALGWSPLTDMAYLEFGPSKLNVVVLTHKSGVRVQLYERLNRPLPEGFTSFERISRPFNVMQMVEDRDAGYDFFQQKLGFDTFFYGKPYVSETEEVMPLGIPPKLTTSTPYLTAIMTPKDGLIYGRMEMIDIEGMADGINYANRCDAHHTGIVSVRYAVDDLSTVRKDLRARRVKIYKNSSEKLSVKTPDGSNIEFYQK